MDWVDGDACESAASLLLQRAGYGWASFFFFWRYSGYLLRS